MNSTYYSSMVLSWIITWCASCNLWPAVHVQLYNQTWTNRDKWLDCGLESNGSAIGLCGHYHTVSSGFSDHALKNMWVSACVMADHVLSICCTRDTPTCFWHQSAKRPCNHKAAIQLPVLPCSTCVPGTYLPHFLQLHQKMYINIQWIWHIHTRLCIWVAMYLGDLGVRSVSEQRQ